MCLGVVQHAGMTDQVDGAQIARVGVRSATACVCATRTQCVVRYVVTNRCDQSALQVWCSRLWPFVHPPFRLCVHVGFVLVAS